ncbi:MAG: hypothetical protein NTW25_12230 [Candidatus Kapabacteria bacterium]|nr:hypothetical protein [Candidatus Kapabacteria bacterium]
MSNILLKVPLKSVFAFSTILTVLFSVNLFAVGIINPVITLSGKIFDKKSSQPIQSFIIVKEENGKTIYRGKSNKNTGFYLITGLKPESKYKISISANEFALKEIIDFEAPKSEKYLEIEKNIFINTDFVVK